MPSYEVKLSRTAEKELAALPARIVEQVYERMMGLELDPRPHGCKKLKDSEGFWRVRSGDYRIIYCIDDGEHRVDVRHIRHRKHAYD